MAATKRPRQRLLVEVIGQILSDKMALTSSSVIGIVGGGGRNMRSASCFANSDFQKTISGILVQIAKNSVRFFIRFAM
jgi:hypothetical protein